MVAIRLELCRPTGNGEYVPVVVQRREPKKIQLVLEVSRSRQLSGGEEGGSER
jgi:hypothetical protein